MTDNSTFEKVTRTEKSLYGPRRLLLCGFGAEARQKFEGLLGMVGLTDVPRVWVATEQATARLSELLLLEDGSGTEAASALPRAVIVAGITEAQLIGLMTACKKTGMQPALWAVLTPVSESWTVGQLLAELAREREAMQKRPRAPGVGDRG
ncbi:MAG: DUF3783 domain-containing protein [Desulfobacterales bacterium]|jgi:hypothetical protein|nr:DUF3783 domain-containing protein [Desulfobacterales bacterium]